MDWQRLSAFPDQALTGAHGIVYWAIREGSVWHQGRRLRAADAASFEVMPGHVFIARDVHSVYHAWTRMPAIDRDSFHRNGDYWQDAGNVYFEHETSLKPLDAVDVGAFRSLGGGYGADREAVAWRHARTILTISAAIAVVSTLPELIRSPLAKKAASAGGMSRLPLSKPVQSLLLP